jgi:hypothetical protein
MLGHPRCAPAACCGVHLRSAFDLMPLSRLRRQPRDCLRKTRCQTVLYSFPVRLFHSRLHAGLSRRFTWRLFHYGSSRLSLIERWSAEPMSKRVRRDSFHSVDYLEKAIAEFPAVWHDPPQPPVWTATVESTKEKISRCRQTLEQIQPGCTQSCSKRGEKHCPVNFWTLHHYYCVIKMVCRSRENPLAALHGCSRDCQIRTFGKNKSGHAAQPCEEP